MDFANGGTLLIALILLGLLAELLISPIITKRRHVRTLKQKFESARGESIDPQDMLDIADYFNEEQAALGDPLWVDDTTWSDLDMDKVFQRLNTTHSDVGEQVLYAMLRRIDVDTHTLKRRRSLIDWLSRDEEARIAVSLPLLRLGKWRYHGVSSYLFHPEGKKPGYYPVYLALAIIPCLILLFAILQPGLLLFYAVLFIINMAVHYATEKTWRRELRSVSKLTAVVRAAQALSKLDLPELKQETDELRALLPTFKPLLRMTGLFIMERKSTLDFITDYLKIALQINMISLGRIALIISKHGGALRRLYSLVGEIDALISASALLHHNPTLCTPEFHDEVVVDASNLVHPLIENAVPNSLNWQKNVLITGSNASGKSTFIRALAINAILAQSLCLAFADKFTLPRAQVLSSMAIRDDVTRGESYFIAEIKSLRRVLVALEQDMPALCFIDEILRGTNTIERIAASSALLTHLTQRNALVMAATHDIELTEILKGSYENHHFQEEFSDVGMHFPYKLMGGPSNTRNAILLLGQMGFPDTVTQAAEARAEFFERERHWRA